MPRYRKEKIKKKTKGQNHQLISTTRKMDGGKRDWGPGRRSVGASIFVQERAKFLFFFILSGPLKSGGFLRSEERGWKKHALINESKEGKMGNGSVDPTDVTLSKYEEENIQSGERS